MLCLVYFGYIDVWLWFHKYVHAFTLPFWEANKGFMGVIPQKSKKKHFFAYFLTNIDKRCIFVGIKVKEYEEVRV